MLSAVETTLPAGAGFPSFHPAAPPRPRSAQPLDTDPLQRLFAQVLPEPAAAGAARLLLARHGSYARLLHVPLAELAGIAGLPAAALDLLRCVQDSVFALARQQIPDRPLLGAPRQLLDYLAVQLALQSVECLHLLYLDSGHRLIADELHSRGTVDQVALHPREILRRALELGASGLIVAHNHPGGDPRPGPADLAMTRELEAAAAVFDIVLLDHLILGDGQHVSLRQEGLLRPLRTDRGRA